MFLKRCFALCFFTVLLMSVSCGVKKEKKKSIAFDENAAKTVSAMTSGVISSTDKIKVRFAKNVIDKNLVGTSIVVPILEFSPEIKGVAMWEDGQTLAFSPSKPLPLNEKYTGKLLIKKLFPSDKNLKKDVIDFSFQVATRELVSLKGDFEPESYDTPDVVNFTGTVLLTEPCEVASVKKAVKILLDDKYKEGIFSFREDLKQFTFVVKGIKRNEMHTIKVYVLAEELGISKDIEKIFYSYVFKELKVVKTIEKSSGTSLYLQVEFSDDLDKGQNLEGLISVEPKVELTTKKRGKLIIVKGDFKNGQTYSLTLSSGIRSKWGSRLKMGYNTSVNFLDLNPEIKFASDGMFLPGSNNRKIQFYTTNLKQVYVTVSKVFESNIGMFLQDDELSNSSSRTNEFYNLHRVGVTVVNNKTLIIGEEKNVKKLNELDLSELISKDARGMYLVKLHFNYEDMMYSHPYPDRYDDYYDDPRGRGYIYDHGKVFKPVLLSSMGMVCKKADKDFNIFVSDIDTGKPLSGINVALRTYQNQISSKGVTNGDGVAKLNDVKDTIYYAESFRGDERSIVLLDQMKMNNSSFDTEGVAKNKEGVKAFIYTERGVYRPGDNVNLSVIVRNEQDTFPENHPLTITIKNPKRQLFLEKILNTAKDGFYSFSFKTDENDPTGNWQVIVKAGDSVFHHMLRIETVVPYKLKIKIDSDKKAVTKEKAELELEVDTKYLFGTPGSDLKTEVRGNLKKYSKKLKNYRGYTFTDESVDFKEIKTEIFNGKLDNEGKVKFKWSLPSLEFAPTSLIAEVEATVFEKGGRPNKQKIKIPVEPFDFYVGLEKPETDYGYVKMGTSLNINTIVVNTEGEPMGGKPLSYKLYRNNLYWWWEYRDRVARGLKYKSDFETELIKEGELVSSNIPIPITLDLNDSGEYYLEVQAGDGHISSFFFKAGYWGSESSGKDGGMVDIKADKNKYNPGDTAKLTFMSPSEGSILVSVEKGFEVQALYTVKPSGNNETTVEIPITKDMVPNVYVAASVIQARNGIKNDRPLRMYGVVPLMVEDKLSREEITIDLPESLESEKPFKVKIQTKDKSQTQLTVAVVDEGLLALTAFETPDPFKFFYSKERLQVITSDMFPYVIGANKGDVFNMFSIGGEMMAEAAKNDKGGKKRRFVPVSLFKGPILTDGNGYAEVEFEMPNYIGAVRVMVVSAKGKKYGNVETTVPVKKDLMIMPTLPRVLHPGDNFILPTTLFAMKDNVGKVDVSVELGENLSLTGEAVKSVHFEKMGESDVFFNVSVGQFIGTTKVVVRAKSSSLNVEKVFDLTVLPVSPRMYKSILKQGIPGDEITLTIPNDGIEGSNEAVVSIMSRPGINIEHRLGYLIRYPYGCIEQTTSSVFPQIFLDQIVNLTDKEKDKINYAVNRAIERLKRFVTPSGGFAYWPGETIPSNWGTSYASHFLIEAQKLGYYVPDSMLTAIIRYQTSMALSTKDSLKSRVYRIYLLALAGYPSSGGMNLLKESSLKEMNNVEKWMLAAAYNLTGDKTTANRIIEGADTSVPSQYFYDESFGSNLRDRAIILETATILGKEKAVDELLVDISRKLSEKEWMSTQTAAYSLMAVGKYFLHENIKSDKKLMAGKIIYPDGRVESFETEKVSSKFKIEKGFGKDAVIEISKKSNVSKVYTAVQWSGVPSNVVVEAESKNISLEVKFYNENGIKIDVDTLKQGETFYATYSVKSNSHVSEVYLEQMLPSGWEIDNTRLSGESLPAFASGWNVNQAQYTDIRDDRIVWFFNLNYSFELKFLVKLNAVTKGTFSLPPTVCEAMYDKESYRAVVPGKIVKVVNSDL